MTTKLNDCLKLCIARLEECGFEAYAVGGCVRDMLLGKEPKDFDVTTSATPEEIILAFSDMKTIETGIKHGTVCVLINGEPVEITTYRVDVGYSDGRHPDNVVFSKSLKDDLLRRDFTMNTLCMDGEGEVLDLCGGTEDLNKGIIRCVGNPDERFSEDSLRIMRAIRFMSVLDFEIEENTKKSIHEKKSLLANISAERKRDELFHLLCGNNVKKALLEYSDVIAEIIPEIKLSIGFEQHSKYHNFDVWGHTVESIALSKNNLSVRLSLLLHDMGKPACYTRDEKGVGHFKGHPKVSGEIAENVLCNLRVDNKTKDTVVKLVSNHDIKLETKKAIRRILKRLTEEEVGLLFEVMTGDTLAHAPDFIKPRLEIIEIGKRLLGEVIEEGYVMTTHQLDISGEELMALGFKGKQIGEAQNTLLDKVIDGEVENQNFQLVCAAKSLQLNLENKSKK